jgi:two-component system sensor histidine kinase/response regulator
MAMMGEKEARAGCDILLVDDDPAVRAVVKEILVFCGCRVDAAGSGPKAVEAFFGRRYDLILMDCQMPGMNGYETTGMIRAMEAKKLGGSGRIPIIAMTGYGMDEDEEKRQQAGMDDYLGKPISIVAMRAILAKWVSLSSPEGLEKADGPGATGIGASREETAVCDRQGALPPIEEEALAEIASLHPGGGEAILAKIISLYLDSSVTLVRSLRTAVEGNDADALSRAAHTLKSSSASLGAATLAEMAKTMEMIGRGKAQGNAVARLAALEQEYGRVRADLERRFGKAVAGLDTAR